MRPVDVVQPVTISHYVSEMADLMVLIVRYCFPVSNCSNSNSRMSLIGTESGSILHSKHQLSHCLQALEYEDSVDICHDFVMMLISLSEFLLHGRIS